MTTMMMMTTTTMMMTTSRRRFPANYCILILSFGPARRRAVGVHLSRRRPIGVQAEPALVSDANVKGADGAELLLLPFR